MNSKQKHTIRFWSIGFVEARLIFSMENTSASPIANKQEAINLQSQEFQKQLRSLQDKLGLTMKNGVITNLEERKAILEEMRTLRGLPTDSESFQLEQNDSSNTPFSNPIAAGALNEQSDIPSVENIEDLESYHFNYSPTSKVEYPTQQIIRNAAELEKMSNNREILPNSTVLLSPGIYAGNFSIWAPNVKIMAQDPSNPPKFIGGPKPYSLIFQEGSCTASHLDFDGGEIGIRLNKENNTVSNCNFSNQQRLGIDCKADNSLIKNCIISKFHKDGIFIQGNNVTVETCNIYDYLGQDDAHNDGIQIAAKVFNNNDKLYSGRETVSNLRIIGNTIDMKKREGPDQEKMKGKHLQGIFAGQVMLEDAVIRDNQISVDSDHGITGSFLGKSLIDGNVLRKAGEGNTIPKINIMASRAANNVNTAIPAEYNVFVGKNEWENCGETEGGHFYNIWKHKTQEVRNLPEERKPLAATINLSILQS